MYTSENERISERRDRERRNGLSKKIHIYWAVSLFGILFGAVYEYFSHDVLSYSMIYAFLPPLILGVLLHSVLRTAQEKTHGRSIPMPGGCFHAGVAALTVGMIMNGVLEIYGTTNRLISVYWIAGAVLLILGIIQGTAGTSR